MELACQIHEIRNQTRITEPNGGTTTLFGINIGGGVYRFFGTSTVAPNVAAVAPDLLPLGATAFDIADMFIDDPITLGFEAGFDFGTGAGLVNAALNALPVPTTLQLKVRHSTKLSRWLPPMHNEDTHQISHKGPYQSSH